MSKKSKSSKSAPKGKKLSAPMKAGLKAVAETSGSKLAKVISLLSRPEGVTLEEIVKATNWQKHTVRGVMSGALKKKRGYTITSTKTDGDDARIYKITKQ